MLGVRGGIGGGARAFRANQTRFLENFPKTTLDAPVISVQTEIMPLEPSIQKFIVHWGEMGTRWGINRSVAQIHALLYVTGRALPADEIAETLELARSNVSTGIRELQSWGLVRVTHTLGDRRDHFDTFGDVWEMLRIILRERKKREITPTVEVLRECVRETPAANPAGEAAAKRLAEMLVLVEQADAWGDRASRLSPQNLKRLSQLGDAIFRLVE